MQDIGIMHTSIMLIYCEQKRIYSRYLKRLRRPLLFKVEALKANTINHNLRGPANLGNISLESNNPSDHLILTKYFFRNIHDHFGS